MSLTVSTRKLPGLADQPQKTKEMSLTVSTRKLPGLADQPQNIQQPFYRRRRTFHLMKWERHRRSSTLPKNEIWISSRNMVTRCFQHIHFSIVTYSCTCQRVETAANCPTIPAFAGMGRSVAVTTRICLYRRKVWQLPCTVSHEQLSVSSVHFTGLEISAPPIVFLEAAHKLTQHSWRWWQYWRSLHCTQYLELTAVD